jgi:homopolymeric O-antigen transport system permease protein
MATALKTQPVAVYTPASKLTDPTQLFQSMLRDLALSRELAWRLFIRNINARYRQTLLGYAWAVVMPIITTSVFVFLQKSGYFTVGETQVPYALFLITGLVLWQVFADAVQAPLRMVQQSYSILTKVNFPREALIITGAGEVLFAFLIRLTLIALAIFWFGIDVSWTAIWFPFGVLVLIGLGIAIGLLITPMAVLYHDIGQALPFTLYLWMFLTPVIYPVPVSGARSMLVLLNPVTSVLDTTRAWLFSGSPDHLSGFFIVSGLTVFTILAGWVLYRLALPILIERVST